MGAADRTHNRKALSTNWQGKQSFQQSDFAHVPPWSHLSWTAPQPSSWHHGRVLPPLLSITGLSPLFTPLPAFSSSGPFSAPPGQEKPTNMQMPPHQVERPGGDGAGAAHRGGSWRMTLMAGNVCAVTDEGWQGCAQGGRPGGLWATC